eukprot:16357492-Heterocapsa_arctica.AAC.1
MQNYTTLRSGIFKFLTSGQAFGHEDQQVPMELDAVTAATRPCTRPGPGKGKGGGPTTTPTGRREIEG